MRPGEFCALRRPAFPPSLVSDWVNGNRFPSYASMVDIERATDGEVPVGAWPVRRRKRTRKNAA